MDPAPGNVTWLRALSRVRLDAGRGGPPGLRTASTLSEKGFMRTVLATVVAMSLAAGTLSAAPAADEKKANPQQEHLKACNSQAADKLGDERKAFMSDCLKADKKM